MIYKKQYKPRLTNIIKFIATFLILVVFSAMPTKADIIIGSQSRSAILYTQISSWSDTHLTIDLVLNPNGQAVNTIGAYLKYSTTTLSLINTDMTNSLCTFTTTETHNEQNGDFLLICGLPNPGSSTSTEAIVTSLTFERIASGTMKIFPQGESMVLANDGLGTNILSETIGTQIIFP